MRRTLGNAACLLMLMAPLAAQHRAPCTGTVRDPAGAVMAGAQVVCVWTPDGGSLAPAEYHETTTDAAGRFAFTIAIGRAHCIWAIGPAAADGRRRVVPPSFAAVGGRELALVADRVTAPAQLQVTGVNSWLRAGPLALRILVAGHAALPDQVIAGDGIVNVPPLPTPYVTVCLLDFRRDVIDSVETDVEGLTPCTFAPTAEVEFAVLDANDRGLAGASILTPVGLQHLPPPRFCNPFAPPGGSREVAVTDAAGRARGLSRRDPNAVFLAMHEGMCSRLSGRVGVAGEERIENGRSRPGDVDEPTFLRVEIPMQQRVQCQGIGDDVVLCGVLSNLVQFSTSHGRGFRRWLMPLTHEGEDWCGGRFGISCATWLGEGVGTIPLRIEARTTGPVLDLAVLRRLDVRVVGADGAAIPFAEVGVSNRLGGFPVHWTTHLVCDAAGRAELRLMPGNCDLYAVTADAHGHFAVADAAVTSVTIRMQPFGNLKVRVVDADRQPVAGVRIAVSHRTLAPSGIERIVQNLFLHVCDSKITDADGLLVGRVPRELVRDAECTATWRGRSSLPFALQLDTETPIEVVLPR